MKKFIITLLLLIILVACSTESKDEPELEEESIEVITSRAEIIAQNLEIPWTITKHKDTFFLTQRDGNIIMVDSETSTTTLQEVVVTKEILHESEGGLLGFTLTPDFPQSQQAIAYHTYRENKKTLNRIILLTLRQDKWEEEAILLEGIPGGRIHNGGRISIGPDEKLYVTTGDAGKPEYAQDIENLAGKILRMELDGNIPVDNPFNQSYVYSYGHRNPQGLAWDDEGNLFSSEHGQTAHDEINHILPGKNYGWPQIEGDQEASDMVSPFYHTENVTWAPSGISIKGNQLFVATLRGESIQILDLNDRTSRVLYEDAGRIRDVLIENDTLFMITNNLDGRGDPREWDDKLIKISLN